MAVQSNGRSIGQALITDAEVVCCGHLIRPRPCGRNPSSSAIRHNITGCSSQIADCMKIE
ncbi:unnamed protein product [Periconia digitata]|uniref:Uncharacterized protein n=1 Tax=Periconia digitata TaxID=1303443 RepID=A0A9W4UPR7_9PLEO|nr:unnamed protein product [Periconia digitata]